MASHRYWRINTTATQGGTLVGIGDVTFYDGSGTSLTPSLATATSSFSGQPASNAIDGNSSTFWLSNGTPSVGSPQILTIDLGTTQDVQVITFDGRPGNTPYDPSNFTIQSSDDNSTWTTQVTITGKSAWGGLEYTSFPITTPASGNYVNYKATWTASTSGNSGIAEFQIAATTAGANINTSAIMWASAVFSSFASANANDGNLATFWDATGLQSIAVALRQPSFAAEVRLTTPSSGNQNDAPSSFSFYGSNDGVTWTLLKSFTGIAAWSTSQQRTFTIATTTTTAVKSQANNVIT